MAFAACTNFGQEVDAGLLEPDIKSLSFESQGGTFSIKIKSGTQWDVTVPSWMKASSISAISGSPFEWNLRGTCEDNDRTESRSGSIVFKTKLKQATVSVYQEAKPVVHVTGVSVSPATLSLGVGDSSYLTAKVSPSNAANQNVTWKSSNTSVATVNSSGRVSGVKAGSATITVTTEDGGYSAYCSVTVGVAVTGISVSPTSRTLTEGDSYTLTLSVFPYNASNKNVTWSSNNTTVATVDSYGTVKAVKEGSATITAKSEDGGFTATCQITVVKATVAVTGVSVSPTTLTMTAGDTYKLTATVSPSNATNKNVTWSSNKTSVATVDSNGNVTAVAAGSATITVKTVDGSKAATCSVTVKPATVAVTGVTVSPTTLSLTEGQSHSLTYVVSPTNATNKNVTWSSSNTSVATVDSNGKVTAVSGGYATVTVKTEDGGKTANCNVTVQTASPSYVDLGLSVKWATFNVGASSAEQYGRYYAWGETAVKTEYSWNSYTVPYGSSSYYSTNNHKVLDLVDDAAYVSWGGKWRMPTLDEMNELLNNCSWSWSQINGVYGYKVTSKMSGYTSKYIFLPAAGYRDGTNSMSSGSDGMYWTSSLSTGGSSSANALAFNSSSRYIGSSSSRYFGFTVRAVYGDPVVHVTGVSFGSNEVNINVGEAKTLSYTVSPSNATDKSVTWSSSNTSVATVSNGTVSGLKAGSATITVKTNDGGYSAYCTVNVIQTSQGLTAVDLGLPSKVKWGSCNLGASKPEDTGDYYAWGEKTPKTYNFSWGYYLWCNGTASSLTKYNLHSNLGSVDYRTVLEASDDAATISLGGQWRVPTREEIQELINYCSWTLTLRGGVYGYNVSRNNNSIFIPVAGYNTGSYVTSQGSLGHYWASSIKTDDSRYAYYLDFSTNYSPEISWGYRCYGLTIRPVSGSATNVAVTGVSLNKSSLTLSVGASETLTFTISPTNATNKNVSWSSSNTSVATVDQNGKVTGVKAGSATITVTTSDGGKKANCSVTVQNGSVNSGDPEGFDEDNGQW